MSQSGASPGPSGASPDSSGASTGSADAVRRGTAQALVGGVCYGVTIVIGRTLAERGLGAPTVLGTRFTLSAVLMFVVLAISGRPLLPAKGERIGVFLLGACVYMVESTFFFMALERGSASAVALIYYCYPAVVTVLEIPFGLATWNIRTLVALALALAGVGLVVGSGADLHITTVGLLCISASILAFSCYMIASAKLMPRSDPRTSAAWVAMGAGTSFYLWGSLSGQLKPVGDDLPLLLGTAGATALAFTLMFLAIGHIGAARTSVLMTVEAFSAVVLGALVLHEKVGFWHAAGGLLILSAAAVIALAPHPEQTVAQIEAQP